VKYYAVVSVFLTGKVYCSLALFAGVGNGVKVHQASLTDGTDKTLISGYLICRESV